jgi:hypothetical protein
MYSVLVWVSLLTQGYQVVAPRGEMTVSELYLAGRTYVYQVGDSKRVTATYRVASVAVDKKGKKTISVELELEELGTSVVSHTVVITNTAVKSDNGNGAEEALFSLPVKPGEKWEAVGEFAGTKVKETRTVKGTEKLETAVGKVEAIRVDFKTTYLGLELTGSQWYARGDGGLIKSTGYVGELTLLRVTSK